MEVKGNLSKCKVSERNTFLAEQDGILPGNEEWKRIYCEETRMVILSEQIIYFGDLAYELIKKEIYAIWLSLI